MLNIVNSTTGLVHLIAAVVSLILGIVIIVKKKGNKIHRVFGYLYFINMLVVNITAFMIYGLYGTFGVFHVFAVISLLTIILGIIPMLKKERNISTHYSFMYWSVVGLYSAFAAEIFTRLPLIILDDSGRPMTIFYKLVGVGVFFALLLGTYLFVKLRPKWDKYDIS